MSSLMGGSPSGEYTTESAEGGRRRRRSRREGETGRVKQKSQGDGGNTKDEKTQTCLLGGSKARSTRREAGMQNNGGGDQAEWDAARGYTKKCTTHR